MTTHKSKTQQLVDTLMAAEAGAHLLQPVGQKPKANTLPHFRYEIGPKYVTEFGKEEREVVVWLVVSDSESIKVDTYLCDKWWISPASQRPAQYAKRQPASPAWRDDDPYSYDQRTYD